MADNKVLITGGAGYIGSHTVLEAIEQGFEVAVIDNLATGFENLVSSKATFYKADTRDQNAIDKIVKEFKPDAVIHFAGSVIVPESIQNPVKYYQNNTAASLNLIESCLQNGIKNFVFSSTAALYGIPDNGEWIVDETVPPAPISPYGRSKRMVEQFLEDVSKAHDFNYASLRYFNVAGADPKMRTGCATPNATHVIKVACETALGLHPAFHIFGTDYDTPDGTGVRDFIHVCDLAKAHLLVLNHIQKEGQSHTLNCGNGKGYSVREVIASVEKISGKKIKKVEEARRAGDPPMLVAKPDALKALTGWQPEYTDLDQIIETAWRWEQKINKA